MTSPSWPHPSAAQSEPEAQPEAPGAKPLARPAPLAFGLLLVTWHAIASAPLAHVDSGEPARAARDQAAWSALQDRLGSSHSFTHNYWRDFLHFEKSWAERNLLPPIGPSLSALERKIPVPASRLTWLERLEIAELEFLCTHDRYPRSRDWFQWFAPSDESRESLRGSCYRAQQWWRSWADQSSGLPVIQRPVPYLPPAPRSGAAWLDGALVRAVVAILKSHASSGVTEAELRRMREWLLVIPGQEEKSTLARFTVHLRDRVFTGRLSAWPTEKEVAALGPALRHSVLTTLAQDLERSRNPNRATGARSEGRRRQFVALAKQLLKRAGVGSTPDAAELGAEDIAVFLLRAEGREDLVAILKRIRALPSQELGASEWNDRLQPALKAALGAAGIAMPESILRSWALNDHPENSLFLVSTQADSVTGYVSYREAAGLRFDSVHAPMNSLWLLWNWVRRMEGESVREGAHVFQVTLPELAPLFPPVAKAQASPAPQPAPAKWVEKEPDPRGYSAAELEALFKQEWEIFRSTGRIDPKLDLGALLLERDIHQYRLPRAMAREARIQWRQLRRKILTWAQELKKNSKLAPADRFHALTSRLQAEGMKSYGSEEDAFFHFHLKPQAGNCVASTQWVLAALHLSKFPVPKDFEIGFQLFVDHVQPVLVSRSQNQVRNLADWTAETGIRGAVLRVGAFLPYAWIQHRPGKDKTFVEDLNWEGIPSNLKGSALSLAESNASRFQSDQVTHWGIRELYRSANEPLPRWTSLGLSPLANPVAKPVKAAVPGASPDRLIPNQLIQTWKALKKSTSAALDCASMDLKSSIWVQTLYMGGQVYLNTELIQEKRMHTFYGYTVLREDAVRELISMRCKTSLPNSGVLNALNSALRADGVYWPNPADTVLVMNRREFQALLSSKGSSHLLVVAQKKVQNWAQVKARELIDPVRKAFSDLISVVPPLQAVIPADQTPWENDLVGAMSLPAGFLWKVMLTDSGMPYLQFYQGGRTNWFVGDYVWPIDPKLGAMNAARWVLSQPSQGKALERVWSLEKGTRKSVGSLGMNSEGRAFFTELWKQVFSSVRLRLNAPLAGPSHRPRKVPLESAAPQVSPPGVSSQVTPIVSSPWTRIRLEPPAAQIASPQKPQPFAELPVAKRPQLGAQGQQIPLSELLKLLGAVPSEGHQRWSILRQSPALFSDLVRLVRGNDPEVVRTQSSLNYILGSEASTLLDRLGQEVDGLNPPEELLSMTDNDWSLLATLGIHHPNLGRLETLRRRSKELMAQSRKPTDSLF